MPDMIHRLDISHEAMFAQPAFALMREFPAILKTFYETFSGRFSVNPAFTTVNSTNTFGELSIRIGLFNNAASVELRPDKMVAKLPNLTTREAIAIAKDTVSLSHEALSKALPDVGLNASNFGLNIWVAMEGGAVAAERLLSKYSPGSPIDVSKWGASTSRYGLRLVSRNDTEGWAATIFGDPSLLPESHLFLSVDIAVSRVGLRPIKDQIGLAEVKLPQIFEALGLHFPNEAIANA
jgi:hypothetical protein